MPEYLSAVEAATVLGCSETLIRARIRTGELAASKHKGKWRILRDDLDQQDRPHQADSNRTGSSNRIVDYDRIESSSQTEPDRRIEPVRTESNTEWRDDLLAQVARLEADKVDAARREQEAGEREERSKARIVDLERAATVREGRIADMEATHADALSTRDAHIEELREQLDNLEAELRDSHSRAEANALGWAQRADELSHRIADLVDKHQQANARVYELEPVAEQVPMLQAAVEEKDASLSERDRELGNMRQDIDAIASRPVTGPVFRLLTKGKLRR